MTWHNHWIILQLPWTFCDLTRRLDPNSSIQLSRRCPDAWKQSPSGSFQWMYIHRYTHTYTHLYTIYIYIDVYTIYTKYIHNIYIYIYIYAHVYMALCENWAPIHWLSWFSPFIDAQTWGYTPFWDTHSEDEKIVMGARRPWQFPLTRDSRGLFWLKR